MYVAKGIFTRSSSIHGEQDLMGVRHPEHRNVPSNLTEHAARSRSHYLNAYDKGQITVCFCRKNGFFESCGLICAVVSDGVSAFVRAAVEIPWSPHAPRTVAGRIFARYSQ